VDSVVHDSSILAKQGIFDPAGKPGRMISRTT
jgi:hypothetical protein